MVHLLLPGIHAHFKNSLQAYMLRSLTLAQEDFLLSLEYFLVALLFYLVAVVIRCIEEQEGMLKPFLWIQSKMEPYSFSLGSPRQETKQQKKERLRKERDRKRKEQDRKERKQRGFVYIPKKPSWLLLPSHLCEGFDFWIQTLEGNSYLSKRADIIGQIDKAMAPVAPVLGFPDGIGKATTQDFITKANKVISLLHLNQAFRWKFKNFLNKVRYARFVRVNTTDPITLEEFKQPICFPSFFQKKVYTFEAESFMKHCHKKLLNHDGQIPLPQNPKNPLTNEEFTVTQLMGLFRQCREACQTSWAIEAYISCQYDLLTFQAVHSKPLKLQAIRSTLANISSWESIDILYDFIKSEHSYHKKPFTPTTYRWAIERLPTHKKIEAWRKLCLKWYETEILIDDYDAREEFFKTISEKTEHLCGLHEDIHILRKHYLKSLVVSDGSSSSRDTESEG